MAGEGTRCVQSRQQALDGPGGAGGIWRQGRDRRHRGVSAFQRRPAGSPALPQGLEQPPVPFSPPLCQLKSEFQALPQALLPAQSICHISGSGGVFSSERSPQLPAAAAGCRSALLPELFPIHQSKVFPTLSSRGVPSSSNLL